MREAEDGLRTYLETVRGKQKQYAIDLIRENETLRAMSATLEDENQRLEAEVLKARIVLQQREELRRASERVEQEASRLAAELVQVQQERVRQEEASRRLQSKLDDIEAENRRYADRYVEIEQQSSNLANLYVASYQLNATVDREQVLTTIKEIVINLIGSENFGLFEHDIATGSLRLSTSFGIDTEAYATIVPGEHPRDRVLVSGDLFVGSTETPSFTGLLAAIPLKVENDLLGVIAIFGLLDHKQGLEAVDLELFDLLAAQASRALYCSNLHEAATQNGWARA